MEFARSAHNVPAMRKFVVIYLYVEMDLLRHLGSFALLTGALPFAFRLRLNQLFRWFKSPTIQV